MSCPPSLAVALALSLALHAALIAATFRSAPDALSLVLAKPRLVLPARIKGVERPVEAPTAPPADAVRAAELPAGIEAVGALDADPVPPPDPEFYFDTKDLDQGPVPRSLAELDAVIGYTSTEGRAVLHFWLAANGNVDRVAVEESTFRDDVSKRLKEYAQTLVFVPGQLRGVPVPTTFRVEVSLDAASEG